MYTLVFDVCMAFTDVHVTKKAKTDVYVAFTNVYVYVIDVYVGRYLHVGSNVHIMIRWLPSYSLNSLVPQKCKHKFLMMSM